MLMRFFFYYSNHQVVPLHRSVFSWAMYLFTLPFRLTYQTAFGVFDFVLSIFGLSGAPSRPRGINFSDFPFMIIYVCICFIRQITSFLKKRFLITFVHIDACYAPTFSCHNLLRLFIVIITFGISILVGRIPI